MTLYLREAKRLGTELTGKDKQKFIDFSRDLAQSEDKFRLDFFFMIDLLVFYGSYKNTVLLPNSSNITA